MIFHGVIDRDEKATDSTTDCHACVFLTLDIWCNEPFSWCCCVVGSWHLSSVFLWRLQVCFTPGTHGGSSSLLPSERFICTDTGTLVASHTWTLTRWSNMLIEPNLHTEMSWMLFLNMHTTHLLDVFLLACELGLICKCAEQCEKKKKVSLLSRNRNRMNFFSQLL